MTRRPQPQPTEVIEAEAWGNLNARFLAAVFERWDSTGAWPLVDDIGRQAIRDKSDFDAFDLAAALPRPLGRVERGPEERIILRVRGLSFVPPAWSLLRDFLRVIRLGAKLYVEEHSKPELREDHLMETLGLDVERAGRIIELLSGEFWPLGSGGGELGSGWHRDLDRSYRYLLDVGSLEDYLLVEGGRLWGRPLSTGIPLQDGPIGDELAFPQITASPTRDVNAAPEPSGSATEPSASTAPAQRTAPQGAQTQPSAAHNTPSVFVSYAREDEVIAQALGDGLARTGQQVWIDRNELLAGDSIIEQISEAVAGIDFFCALVSEASRESRWCKHELSLAMTSDLGRAGTIVIPIRVGDVTMPESIADKLYIQLDPADVTATVERITDDVRRHLNRRHEIANAPELRADSESDRTTRLGAVPAAVSSALTPAREARHLTEDMRRWIRDRDRVLQSATAVTRDEMNARGAFHSSIHLAAQAELRHQALHEYRDEISRKRRRYQELGDAPIGGSELPRFELDDGSREILARWRAPVTVPGMDDHLSVDDPTDLALEPGLREFERGGDGPEDSL